jgi:hypothetical protein
MNMKTFLRSALIALTIVGVAIAFALPAIAADEQLEVLKKENAELRERVDKLANELDAIKGLLTDKGVTAPPKASEAKPVTSKFDIQLYGFIKLDAAFDDSRVSLGNFARWVESEAVLDDDGHFSMTANQTRLGMLINGPQFDGVKTSGQIEIDFYGAGAAENKPEPMLRHAFVKAEWLDHDFSLLAGQTNDIISPLFAPTVNYTVAWMQGNIGYRRPQIRLTKGFKLADKTSLKLEFGPTRTITDRKFVFTGSTDPDSGADAGFPTLQSRAALTFPLCGKRATTVGVSGHWGGEEQHETGLATDHEEETWSVNADLRVPITDWLLFQAEGFVGENLSAYLGGIGQGFDSVTQDSVGARGGWAAVTVGPCGKWQFNLGAGVDDVDNGDVAASTDPAKDARTSNVVYFGNAYYSLNPSLQLALEISHLRTHYKAVADGDDWRQQLAVIFKF